MTNVNTTQNLTQEAQNLINSNFMDDFKSAIELKDRWCKTYRSLDILYHILAGSTVVLAFIGGIVVHPVVSIIAGATGTFMLVCTQYSTYAKTQYEAQSAIIEEYSKNANVNDILVDESPEMNSDTEQQNVAPANTPVHNNNTPVVQQANTPIIPLPAPSNTPII